MDKDLIQYLHFDNSWAKFCAQFSYNAYWPGLVLVLLILVGVYIYLRFKANSKPKSKMDRDPSDYKRISNIVLILTALGVFFCVGVLKTANSAETIEDKISNTLTANLSGSDVKVSTNNNVTDTSKDKRFTGYMDVENHRIINITHPTYNKIAYHPVNNIGRGYLLMLHYMNQREITKKNQLQISANVYYIKATYVKNNVKHYVEINTNWPYVVRDGVNASVDRSGDDAG